MLRRRPALVLTLAGIIALALVGGFALSAHQASAQLTIDLALGSTFGIGTADLQSTVINIVNYVLGALGLIAVIVILYGGFLWMLSRGNAQQVEKAKRVIRNAVIGLVIVLLSWAIVQFVVGAITNSTGGTNTNGGPGGCPSPPCMLSVQPFRLKSVDPARGTPSPYPSDNVMRCSSLPALFNNTVNPDLADVLANPPKLDVVKASDGSFAGTYTPAGNTITFKHKGTLFEANTNYELRAPRRIVDKTSKLLNDCTALQSCNPVPSPPPGHEYWQWPFSVGSEVDTTAPNVVSAYPELPGSATYPNQNVTRQPIITVNFDEPVDPTTVIDTSNGNGNPVAGSVFVEKLTGQGGTVVSTVPATQWVVQMGSGSKGFNLSLSAPNALDAFTWYRITVRNVEDLCANAMAAAKTWEFETNDQIAGFSAWYPTGDKECPSSFVLFSFSTSMYNHTVSVDLAGAGAMSGQFSPLAGSYNLTSVGGTFAVLDPDLVNPGKGFKQFRFTPGTDLPADRTYTVNVTTDRVIDSSGTLLAKQWTFKTTTADKCACAPVVTGINPDIGPTGQCVTITGACFTGTTAHPATAELAYSKDNFQNDTTPGTAGGVKPTYITSTIPISYAANDFVKARVKITYQDTAFGVLTSQPSASSFQVTSGTANGPCLFDLSPDSGLRSSNLSAIGTRFNPGSATKNLTFTSLSAPGGTVSANNISWTDTQINSKVPSVPDTPYDADTGPVFVKNDAGTSNWLPFMVIIPPPGTPVVTSSWPSCDAACRNALLGATFSLDMDQGTFTASTVRLRKCTDSSCATFASPDPTIAITTVAREVTITPPTLDVDAWYRVILTSGLTSTAGAALGGLNYATAGGANDAYSWTFKTKNDPTLCTVQSVTVTPASKTLNALGQTVTLTGTAKGSPDSCSAGGQSLNVSPWAWSSSNSTQVYVDPADTDRYTAARADAETVPGPAATVTATAGGRSGTALIAVDLTYCDETTDCTAAGACPGSSCNNAQNRCTPVVNALNPASGTAGNYVTVNGCYFGSYVAGASKVTFTDNKVGLVPDAAVCGTPGSLWTNSSITTEVPPAVAAGPNPVSVTRSDGVTSPNGPNFDENGIVKPGLCKLSPTVGNPGTNITLSGKNFGATRGASDGVTFTSGVNVTTYASWADTQIQSSVPNGSVTGGVYVFKGTNQSNALNFTVKPASCSVCTPNQPGQCTVATESCGSDGCCAPRPAITSVAPTAGATNTCRNAAVNVTFDRDVKASSVTPGNLVLLRTQTQGGAAPVVRTGTPANFTTVAAGCLMPGSDANGSYVGSCVNSYYVTTAAVDFGAGGPEVLALTTANNGNTVPYTPTLYDRPITVNAYLDNGTTPGTLDGGDARLGTFNNPAVLDPYTGYLPITAPAGAANVILEWTSDWIDPIGGSPAGDVNIKIYNLTLYPSGQLVPARVSATGASATVAPSQLLDRAASYLVRARGAQVRYGILSQGGAPLLDPGSDGSPTDRVWTFTTMDSVSGCVPDHVWVLNHILAAGGRVRITPPATQVGPTSIYGLLQDANDQILSPIPGVFDWSWSWTTDVPARATVAQLGTANPCTGYMCGVTFQNNAGVVKAQATATATAGWTGSKTGTGEFEVITCEGAWFFSDSSANCSTGDCTNSDQHLSTYYCPGTGTSALPTLNYQIISGKQGSTPELKEYFFKENDTMHDAIGIKVLPNPSRLSPLGWIRSQFGAGKTGSATRVGSAATSYGYPAVQDGNTVYVAGTNLVSSTLYPNIYVLSYNSDAAPATKSIFDQLVKNLRFNSNVAGSYSGQIWHDMQTVGELTDIASAILAKGTPQPALASGSYLPSISTSAWPSWGQVLGSALGITMPKDPSQGFNNCPADHAQDTCWKEATRDFQCPVGSRLYGFRNFSSTSSGILGTLQYSGTGSWISGGVIDNCLGVGGSTSSCPCFNYNIGVSPP